MRVRVCVLYDGPHVGYGIALSNVTVAKNSNQCEEDLVSKFGNHCPNFPNLKTAANELDFYNEPDISIWMVTVFSTTKGIFIAGIVTSYPNSYFISL